jgi:hypothetical protein
MNRKQKQGCLWIGAGCLVVGIMLVVAVAGGGAWFAYQSFSLSVDKTTEASAQEEFARVRARFSGQQPLVLVDENGQPTVTTRKGAGPVEWLHVVAFDPRKGELARVKLPFWLLRFADGGKLSLGDTVRDLDLQLTTEQVEAAGPGLIVDHRDKEQHLLIWTE